MVAARTVRQRPINFGWPMRLCVSDYKEVAGLQPNVSENSLLEKRTTAFCREDKTFSTQSYEFAACIQSSRSHVLLLMSTPVDNWNESSLHTGHPSEYPSAQGA